MFFDSYILQLHAWCAGCHKESTRMTWSCVCISSKAIKIRYFYGYQALSLCNERYISHRIFLRICICCTSYLHHTSITSIPSFVCVCVCGGGGGYIVSHSRPNCGILTQLSYNLICEYNHLLLFQCLLNSSLLVKVVWDCNIPDDIYL